VLLSFLSALIDLDYSWVLDIGRSRGGLPGVCEDDVVARSVSAAAAGRGRASEAEFEDHIGGVMCRGLLAMVCASINCRRLEVGRSYNLRSGEELRVRGLGLSNLRL
jgi:hypothetical protein